MLEIEGRLRTWSLAEPIGPGEELAAKALPDHRLAYLDYEGPIGGGRGKVTRMARGDYRVLAESEAELLVELQSVRLTGRVTLTQQSGDSWTITIDSAPPAPG
jgi:hypothetical protein